MFRGPRTEEYHQTPPTVVITAGTYVWNRAAAVCSVSPTSTGDPIHRTHNTREKMR